MPAVSREQRIAAAIALHAPEKLHSRNRGMLSMTKKQLADYASRPDRSLRAIYKGKKKQKK